MDVNKPVVKIQVDKKNAPFKWVFHKGGKQNTGIDGFQLSSTKDGKKGHVNDEVSMPDLNLKDSRSFALKIACSGDTLTVQLNDGVGEDSFDTENGVLSNATEVMVTGGLTLTKAGYTGQVFLNVKSR